MPPVLLWTAGVLAVLALYLLAAALVWALLLRPRRRAERAAEAALAAAQDTPQAQEPPVTGRHRRP